MGKIKFGSGGGSDVMTTSGKGKVYSWGDLFGWIKKKLSKK